MNTQPVQPGIVDMMNLAICRYFELSGTDQFLLNNYRYDRNWILLMYAVESIEKGDYGFKMCRKRVEVYIDSTKEVLIDIKKSSRIESLFHALYQFIQLFNSQNPTQ